jgi:hypothetical protein
MQVRVLRAGVFNGPGRSGESRHRALPWASEGALIEVADGAYAESLLADGWVAAVREGGGDGEGEGETQGRRDAGTRGRGDAGTRGHGRVG